MGYTTLKIERFKMHLTAISNSILCPIDTKIGFTAPLLFLTAAPQAFPLCPISKLISPAYLISF